MPDTLDKPGKPDNFRLYEQRLRRLFCRGFESDFALRASPGRGKIVGLHLQASGSEALRLLQRLGKSIDCGLVARLFTPLLTAAAVAVFALFLTLVDLFHIGGDELQAPFGTRPSLFIVR
jgi:hypothetical protein